MKDIRACRGCLNVNVKLEKINNNYKQIYTVLTGLKISDDDEYPTYFCLECRLQFKKVLAFRRKVKRAHYTMKEILTVRNQVSYSDIVLVDRKKTNLESSIGYWKTSNIGCYAIDVSEPTESNIDTDKSNTTNTVVDLTNTVEDYSNIATYNSKISTTKYVSNYQSNTATENVNTNTDSSNITHESNVHIGNNTKVSITINNSGCIPNMIIDFKETNIKRKAELMKYEPKVNECATCEIIDIKPAILPEENNNEETDINLIENDNDDNTGFTETNCEEDEGNIDTENIDLDDVFKDLKEDENVDEDDYWPDDANEEQNIFKRKKKGRKTKTEKQTHKEVVTTKNKFKEHKAIKLSSLLTNVTIIPLSLEQQIEVHEKRKTLEPFLSARYKCSICFKTLQYVDQLMEHVNFHRISGGTHVCKVCKWSFQTGDKLFLHGHEWHLFEYRCNYCEEVHTTLDSIAEHLMKADKSTHSKPKDISKIKFILKNFDIVANGANEMLKSVKHTPMTFQRRTGAKKYRNSKYQCDVCKLWFVTQTSLEKHMSKFHLWRYVCKICKEVLFNVQHARVHYQGHYTSSSNPIIWSCEYCDQVFSWKTSLSQHKLKEHNDKVYRHHCNLCGVPYTTLNGLYKHQLADHQMLSISCEAVGQPEFRCEECDVQFANKRAYQTHQLHKMHEGAEPIENSCHECKFLFDTAEEYNNHMENCKPSQKKMKKCCYCDMELPNWLAYRKHHSQLHRDLPYIATHKILCSICGLMVHSTLSEHIRIHHVGAGMHPCRYCSAKFTTATQYTVHVLMMHATYPFCCALCGSRHRRRWQCRDHLLKTHKLNRIKCKECGHELSHIESLNDHYLRRHGINLAKDFPEIHKQFIPVRLFGKVYVYPHMVIDASMLDKETLEHTEVELTDYMHKSTERVKYNDYLSIFPLPYIEKPNTAEETDKSFKRKVKPIKADAPDAVAKKKKRKNEDIHETDEVHETDVVHENYDFHEIGDIGEFDDINETKRAVDEINNELIVNEEIDATETVVEEIDSLIADEGQIYLNEDNGEQYVKIGGVLYKVETEDQVQ